MEVYLDNAATTKVFPQVKDLMIKIMEEDFGNPSSMHRKGIEAENYIKTAKSQIAKTLKIDTKELCFTSGGTESNNLAIIGTAMANQRRGKHIITTCIEHPSVYNPFIYLEEQGFRVTFLPVDEQGIVKLDCLREAIQEDTTLVSIMYVNNEIGSVQPIEEIGKLIKSINKEVLFHVDAIQAYGKFMIHPKRLLVDLLSISGHKFHGPKGVGILYIKDKVKIKPILFGGSQQKGLRSGTENVPGIAGIGLAAELMYKDYDSHIKHLFALKESFLEQIKGIEDIKDNSGKAPHIISISFKGIRSEVLLHALEEKSIYVSAGSACSSNKPAVSGTLKGIGLEKEHYESTLRFSLSVYNTQEDINKAAEALKELVPMLRRFTRR